MRRSTIWIGAALVALALLYLPTLGFSGGQLLLLLLVLLCPLVHLLGMHRHGHHEGGNPGTPEPLPPDALGMRSAEGQDGEGPRGDTAP